METPETATYSISAEGRSLQAAAAPQLQPMVEGLLETFSEFSEEWREGYSVWYGWGPIILRQGGDESEFVAESPDYTTDPRSRRTEDLTLAIWPLVGMTEVLSAADLHGAEIKYDDDLLCVIGWEQSAMLQVSRIETTTPGDSGWFIEPFPSERANDWATDELVRLPAWRVMQLRSVVTKTLALPVGIAAIIENDHIRAVIRESDREVLATNL